jgi:hypothetical protein
MPFWSCRTKFVTIIPLKDTFVYLHENFPWHCAWKTNSFFGGQKTDKIVWAYLQILYLDNFYLCARRLPPLLMLLRLPPSLFEASFVAFASSNVDVSWYLSAMLIDTNCGFAVGYEFYLLRWIMCSQLRLLQYNIWVALAVVKCFFLSTLKLDHLTE